MPAIHITVANKTAVVTGTPAIVCGNSDYVISFTFDSEWSSYTDKTARFSFWRNGDRGFIDVDFTGTECNAPVLTDIDEVKIGVYAGDIRTSTPARIPCAACITDGDAEEAEPVFDVFNTITQAISDYKKGNSAGYEAGMQALHDYFDEIYGESEG